MSFNGTATLTYYPEITPCVGCAFFSGSASATDSGLASNGSAYAASWPDVPLNSSFNYSDDCPITLAPGVPSLTGWASGVFTLTGGTFLVGGTGDPATLTLYWTWHRYGTVAEVSIQNAYVSGRGGAVAAETLDAAEGIAAYVPLVPPLFTAASCASRSTASDTLTATVAAANLQLD